MHIGGRLSFTKQQRYRSLDTSVGHRLRIIKKQQKPGLHAKAVETDHCINTDAADASISSTADKNSGMSQENDIETANATNETVSTSTLYTFHYPPANMTLHGLSITLPQFKSWILYKLNEYQEESKLHVQSESESEQFNVMHYVSSKEISTHCKEIRNHLRNEWFQRRLICDRTEVLAVYPSDSADGEMENDDDKDGTAKKKYKKKRGGFEDLLTSYVDRLVGILHDEMEDGISNTLPNSTSLKDDASVNTFNLQSWLENEYGKHRTNKLLIHNFEKLSLEQQRNAMLHLLQWFREKFPYYYDRCGECGASYRDDADANGNTLNIDDEGENESEAGRVHDDLKADDSQLQGSFLGYCYPDNDELAGKAARTEMYQCHECGSYTRFPRYNAVKHIVQNGGRGRCGEYSILLYRILRTMGHQSRWIVDFADHVWAECWIGNQWVHMDPCEAALDHRLLYEEWGKKQTYIVALWMPLVSADAGNRYAASSFPLIQDVTIEYTSDSQDEISSRRKEDAEAVVAKAKERLLEKLTDIKRIRIL